MLPLRISGDALAYACESSGRCCHGWPVEADRETAEALPGRIAGIPCYAGKTVLAEGDPASTLHYRSLVFTGGQCVFLNPDLRCDLHARFGPSSKPLICRQYPHLAISPPLGTEISLTYSCPSAAKRLLDPGPFRICQDPPSAPVMTYTKDVPAHYPLQADASTPMSWESLRTAQDALLAALASGEGDPSKDLALARAGIGHLPKALPLPSGSEVERLAGEAVALTIARRRHAKPWPGDLAKLERLESFALQQWEGTARAWAGSAGWSAFRRYLSAKCFGNLLFITYGLIPAFQTVLLLGLLVRLEAARRAAEEARIVRPPDVAGAVEVVDRLFPHESGIFDFWSRKGSALESTMPPVSAALILAGSPSSP